MAGEFVKFGTVATILQQAMPELGLATPTSFIGNTETTVKQLVAFLTSAGQDLCLMHDWQMLHKEWTQVLVPSTTSYALPSDWNDFVNGAMWDNSSAWPVIGSLTPQIWRMLKARNSGGANIALQYRIIANRIVFFENDTSDTIVADYYSRGWILQADGTTYRDNPAADSDQILFDSRIMIPFIKFKWRAAKGFDTNQDTQDFNNAWDLVVGRDNVAPTLSIGPRAAYPYLGYGNIPDSNYGT